MPTPSIHITTLQTTLHWENPVANRALFDVHLEQLHTPTDVVVLPEMFATAFSMQPEALAETMQGESIAWMRRWANQLNAVLCGSLIIREEGKYYNRLIWMRPDGTLEKYDKRHLFTLAGEDKAYTAGQEKVIVEWKGWKFCLMICYDLRFPVWSRNTEAYDVLLYVANFPARRSHAWKALLVARAIENQCYTVAVNRIGNDKNNVWHSGDSCIIDYEGNPIYLAPEGEEAIATHRLEVNNLLNFRKKLNFLSDRDNFYVL
jgi:omega-amidase